MSGPRIDDTQTRRKASSDHLEWPALMERAQDGDQAAYRQLLKSMLPSIQSLVRRRIFDAVLADDVIQDTLLTLHRVRHTYDPARPILPWIAAIASARAIDGLRRQGRIHRRELWDEQALTQELSPDAPHQMEAFAMTREVDQLLIRLPARQREAVEMVKLQEMSLSDAAAASSQSVPAIKALLHRAFLRLRQTGSSDHG